MTDLRLGEAFGIFSKLLKHYDNHTLCLTHAHLMSLTIIVTPTSPNGLLAFSIDRAYQVVKKSDESLWLTRHTRVPGVAPASDYRTYAYEGLADSSSMSVT